MPRKLPPEGYITAGEATAMLQVTDAMLSKYVKQNRLQRYGPEERKHKYYKLSEVQAIINSDKAFFEPEPSKSSQKNDTIFARATPEDMEGVYEVAASLFPHTTSAADRIPLVAKCPDGNYIVRDKTSNKIVAYIHLQPLRQDRLEAFVRGEIRGWQLTSDDLISFEPGREINLLLKSMGATRQFGEEKALYYIQRLLLGTGRAMADLGRKGVIIQTIYATSETQTGIHLALHAKMETIGRVDHDRFAFALDVSSSDLPLLQPYKEALAQWQQRFPANLERQITQTDPSSTTKNLLFRKATLDDLEAEGYLAYLCFGPRARGTMPMRRAFLQHNPDMFYHLYDQDNLAAAINIVPLKGEAIEEFKQGKRGWLFDLDKIEQFTPGPHHLIIIDFMSAPVESDERRTLYATQLLMHLGQQFKRWAERGVEILSIHASGGTELGKRILRSAGFRELGEPVPGRTIFELDVPSSSLKILQSYKETLAQYRHTHSEHQT